ncbi:hypothetical protein KGF56_001218 [Candida oxycetoniae]|uniref:Uncharacterized protein n=1 Tax=Candida oxycetoniae TaxID=497107 RepID=A0AAI9T094_9ASCO|nr:uncharacterized protein KGF56_001218 [Candida oxycetoniae]KAI3405999.2 hypothetical protein KGF56_001218 [Candida oxycetoniae]
MDLSNLSSTLPKSKPLYRKSDEASRLQSSDHNYLQASSSSQSTVSDFNQNLTSNFKDAAKAVASLYNTALNVRKNPDSGQFEKSILKTEFSNAARSVAALYKLGHSTHAVSQERGYLECIDDLLQVITNNEDIENWALTRRAEITNTKRKDLHDSSPPIVNTTTTTTTTTTTPILSSPSDTTASETEDFKLPHDFVFQYNSDLKPPVAIRPSIPPISVQHNAGQRNLIVSKKNKRHQQMYKKLHSSEDSSESELDDNNNNNNNTNINTNTNININTNTNANTNANKRVKIFKDHVISPIKKKKKKMSKG